MPRTCPCGNEPEHDRGLPRCVECRLAKRRAYAREYKRSEYHKERLRKGLPAPGDSAAAQCKYCPETFTFVYRTQTRRICDQCKKKSGQTKAAVWRKAHPEYQAAWFKAHPEQRAAYARKYYGTSAGYATATAYSRNVARFRKYGLTKAQFEAMLARQSGRCAICRAAEPGGRHNAWHTDHDRRCCGGSRSCGACVRGLLCNNCNTGLGFMRDDPKVLIAAAEYIKHTRQSKLFIA